MFQSFLSPSSANPDRQSVYHTVTARPGQLHKEMTLTGTGPLELRGDGQVDSFMLEAGSEAISSLDDPRVTAFRTDKTLASGWSPILSGRSVVGFENEHQAFQMLSAGNPVLTTQLRKGEQIWTHSLSARNEGLSVEEPLSETPRGQSSYELSVAQRQGRPAVCVLGHQYVEVSGAPTLDGPFLDALKTRESVWQGYGQPITSLQEAWNLAEPGIKGQQGQRMVARDATGGWAATQEIELDTEQGQARLRMTLPGAGGQKLEETVSGNFADGQLVYESLTKALRVIEEGQSSSV